MAKENKFTKSVLERLSEDRKKEVVSKPIDNPQSTAPQPKKSSNNTKSNTKPISSKQNEEGRGESTIPDLSAFLSKEPPRTAKNKTFYLDTDVIDTIKKAAKDGGTTDSKLVNDIMRKVLGLDL